jgi:hypothetical protein
MKKSNSFCTRRRGRLTLALFVGMWLSAAGSSGSAIADDKLFEVTPMVGYQFGGNVDLENGEATIDSNPAVGLMMGLRMSKNSLAILSYQIQLTDVELSLKGQPKRKSDLNVGYLQIGGELDGRLTERIRYFFGGTVGTTHFSPKDGNSEWYFSGTIFSGAKYRISEMFGIRAQIRMLGTVLNGDSSWLCTSQGGCLIQVKDVTGTIQGDVGVGVYVRF